MTQQEFEEKVNQYVEAKKGYSAAKEDYDEVVAEKPQRPTQVTCIEEVQNFYERFAAYERDLARPSASTWRRHW